MKVRDLLDREEKWCQGHEALDASGHPVLAEDIRARRWCLIGALILCHGPCPVIDTTLREAIERRSGQRSVSVFNDSVSFAEVRAVIEEAGI